MLIQQFLPRHLCTKSSFSHIKRSTPLSFINVDISQRLHVIQLPYTDYALNESTMNGCAFYPLPLHLDCVEDGIQLYQDCIEIVYCRIFVDANWLIITFTLLAYILFITISNIAKRHELQHTGDICLSNCSTNVNNLIIYYSVFYLAYIISLSHLKAFSLSQTLLI